MFVPAFEFAMSRFDREVGHVRRYTVTSMRSALTEAGLEIVEARYVNLPGLPAWFVGMRLLGCHPARVDFSLSGTSRSYRSHAIGSQGTVPPSVNPYSRSDGCHLRVKYRI